MYTRYCWRTCVFYIRILISAWLPTSGKHYGLSKTFENPRFTQTTQNRVFPMIRVRFALLRRRYDSSNSTFVVSRLRVLQPTRFQLFESASSRLVFKVTMRSILFSGTLPPNRLFVNVDKTASGKIIVSYLNSSLNPTNRHQRPDCAVLFIAGVFIFFRFFFCFLTSRN